MIFLEHDKYKKEIQLKDIIISEQDSIISRYETIDSVRNIQLTESYRIIDSLHKDLHKRERKLKMLKGFTIGGFSLSAILIPFIFIK